MPFDFETQRKIFAAAFAAPTSAEGDDGEMETSMFGKKDIETDPDSAVPPPPKHVMNKPVYWKNDPRKPVQKDPDAEKEDIYNEYALLPPKQRKPQWRPKRTPEQLEEDARKRWDYAQRWVPMSLRKPYPGSGGRGDPEATTHRSALGGSSGQKSRDSTQKSASRGWRSQWSSGSQSWNRGRSWASHR